MPRLVVNPDSPQAWEVELQAGVHSIGRSEDNEIQLDHSSVSSTHCQILVSDEGARIKDLGSVNGTFVGGQLVEEAALQSGQVFQVGNVCLRFEAERLDTPVPASAAGPAPERGKATPRARTLPGAAARMPQRQPRFVVRLGGAFLYPLSKDGVLLLAGGTIFFSLINALKFFAKYATLHGIGLGSLISLAFLLLFVVFGTGYLTSYLQRVVTGTALGDQGAPDWPDISDFGSDIAAPFFQLVGTVLASFLLMLAVAMFVPRTVQTEAGSGLGATAIWVACGVGCVYFPMAFLAVAMFDTIAAVNPLLVVPSIAKIPGAYLLTVMLLGAVMAVKWSGDYFLPKLLPVPIVPSILSSFVGLYLLTVEARLLGVLYLANKGRLGWFGSQSPAA